MKTDKVVLIEGGGGCANYWARGYSEARMHLKWLRDVLLKNTELMWFSIQLSKHTGNMDFVPGAIETIGLMDCGTS